MCGRSGLVAGIVGLVAASAGAQVFYDASAKRIVPGDTRAYFYNPGPSNGGQSGHIVFDDVTVPAPGTPTLPQTLFNIKRVTFGISRRANAPAVQITPYYAGLFPDAQQFGGGGDGPNFDALFPTQIPGGPVSLPANGASFVDGMEVSFGDGVHTLFNVFGANASLDTSYRSFALGLMFSTVSSDNGWTIAEQPNNLDVVWDYANNSAFAEFTYPSDSSGLIIGTQYIKVEGLVLSGLAGDANTDGFVNINDLATLATNWQAVGDFAHGDFNFDGFVDIADLAILATNWQVSAYGSPSFDEAKASVGLGAVSVPEPAFGAVVLVGVLARRRRCAA